MEKDLIPITIGIDFSKDRGLVSKRMTIWVKKDEKFMFDSIHESSVKYEAEKQAVELAKSYISKAVFNLLKI